MCMHFCTQYNCIHFICIHFYFMHFIVNKFSGYISIIGFVTVMEAILTSRQPREKLQCLDENLMSNNFHKTAVLKKYKL